MLYRRSSYVRKKIAKFTEKDLRWSLFFIEKRLRQSCFFVNFEKFLTASFIEHLWATAPVNLYPLELRSLFALILARVDNS